MVPWIQVFLDTPAAYFDEAVAFWAAVTGWRPSPRRGEDGQFLTLLPPAGSAYVKVQAVDRPAGIHLDLDTTDRPAAVERARALGATTAWTYHGVEVMRSPAASSSARRWWRATRCSSVRARRSSTRSASTSRASTGTPRSRSGGT